MRRGVFQPLRCQSNEVMGRACSSVVTVAAHGNYIGRICHAADDVLSSAEEVCSSHLRRCPWQHEAQASRRQTRPQTASAQRPAKIRMTTTQIKVVGTSRQSRT